MNINCLFIRHGLTRGLHLLLLAVALGGGALTRAANIVWVTDNTSALPMLVPRIVDSLSGAFCTRPGNAELKPRVTPNTSPFGSSISWP